MCWMPNVWKQEFCQEIILPIDLTQCLRSWHRHKNFWSQSPESLWIPKNGKHINQFGISGIKDPQESIHQSLREHFHLSHHSCRSYRCVFTGLPWELPWATGSQQAGRGEVQHGRWRCFGGCGAEGPWFSSLVPPCALDPGDGQTPAALGSRPLTSRPGEGGNSGCAWRGQAGLGEHWRPQPTQGQRKERAVKWIRLYNMLMCICTASGIFLRQWAMWAIVVEYNMMIEWEGSQRFFNCKYIKTHWFMFHGYAIWKRGAKHQPAQSP